MSNNDDKKNDFVNVLKAAGIIAVTTYGYYKLLKAVESWEKGQVVSYEDLAKIREEIPVPKNPTKSLKYGNCDKHGNNIEFCQRDNHCMKCGGGVEKGDTSLRWCEDCDWDFNNNND